VLGTIVAIMLAAFVTGALARLAVPGPDPMPAWLTLLIGLVGSVVGGAIAVAIAGKNAYWTGLGGLLASVLLVVGYRRFVQKRPLTGPGALRFPERGFGVSAYRERLKQAGIDPDRISPIAAAAAPREAATGDSPPAGAAAEDPLDNPAYYLRQLEELHDAGVLEDDEYEAARVRLLNRLRS
jgi:uncharacterized membrane protein YeaQ/YmgE (transglycosylase-associated protein family)